MEDKDSIQLEVRIAELEQECERLRGLLASAILKPSWYASFSKWIYDMLNSPDFLIGYVLGVLVTSFVSFFQIGV